MQFFKNAPRWVFGPHWATQASTTGKKIECKMCQGLLGNISGHCCQCCHKPWVALIGIIWPGLSHAGVHTLAEHFCCEVESVFLTLSSQTFSFIKNYLF